MSKKKQTRAQAKSRAKRLKKIEKLKEEQNKINQRRADLKRELEKLDNDGKEIEKEIQNTQCDIYNDKEVLDELQELGSQTTFSKTMLNELKNKYPNGVNVDDIESGCLNIFFELDKVINREIPRASCISELFSNVGDKFDFNDEEGDEDEKN